jgi:hypothetical protein
MDPHAARDLNRYVLVRLTRVKEEPAVHLTVLAVPGCPNVKLFEQHLMQALEGSRDITVSRHEITDQDQATRRGMNGSPTLLIDGIDPFGRPGQQASMSCRLFREGRRHAGRAPSAGRLRDAIGHPVTVVGDADSESWLDAIGRGGQGRIAPAERGLRAMHHAVLRFFAGTGIAPGQAVLDNGLF